MRKKILPIFLSTLMCFQGVPVYAEGAEDLASEIDLEIAEEKEDEVVVEEELPAESLEDQDAELVNAEEEIIYAYELPEQPGFSDGEMFYPGEPSEDDLIIIENKPAASIGKKKLMANSKSVVYYQTPAEAAAVLVEQLVNRDPSPSVYVDFSADDYANWTAVAKAVVNAAFVHDGVPTHGDYVQNQYYTWGCKMYPVTNNGFKGQIVYSFKYLDDAAQEEELGTAIEDLLNELDVWSLNSDLEKFTRVYTWITSNVTYDTKNLNDSTYLLKHSAYAALLNRTAVCQGYATLLYRLCLRMGIDCRYITGGGHAWNLVKIDGLYYYADATWDARLHPANYAYFLVTRDNFTNHTVASDFVTEDWVAAYPSGSANIPYPDSEKKPAMGIAFREGTQDVYEMNGERIQIFADVYPGDSYEGDVSYQITKTTVNGGRYQLGNSSSLGKYVAILPEKAGTFTVKASGGGFEITKTFTVVEPEPDSKGIIFTFEDIDEDPQNLEDYEKEIEVAEGEEVTVDQDALVGDLIAANFVIEDELPEVLTFDSEDEYVIKVSHKKEMRQELVDSTLFTRNIKFVDAENGEAVADPIAQELYYDYIQEITHDLVTGNDHFGEITEGWRDGKYTFDSVEAPAIENMEADRSIDALAIDNFSDQLIEESILYTRIDTAPVSKLEIVTSEKVNVRAYVDNTEDKVFLGWAGDDATTVIHPAFVPFTVSESQVLYAVFGDSMENRALDVNARVDGRYSGSTSGIATFDVIIDGMIVKGSATDFYKKYPVGTEFEITNIQTAPGYIFTGVSSAKSYGSAIANGSLKGRIMGDGVTEVALSFVTEDYTGTAGNVAKDLSVPVIEGAMQGEYNKFVVGGRPDSTFVFGGWDESGNSSWQAANYLDINARVDGVYKGNTKNFAKFDVYINGEMSARAVTDYYKRWPAGTDVEIKNVSSVYAQDGLSTRPFSTAHAVISSNPGVMEDNYTEMLLAFTNPQEYLDINCLIDGKYSGSTSGIATFDVEADGVLMANDAKDFYKKISVGGTINVTDIKVSDGYEFVGVASRRSYGGTLPVGDVSGQIKAGGVNDILLMFQSK